MRRKRIFHGGAVRMLIVKTYKKPSILASNLRLP
uniref:Uncharacterized protein n=1 Tax=Romanomermis culicivorax TaxID=13658 RepID=A0A915ILE0_ROMCU